MHRRFMDAGGAWGFIAGLVAWTMVSGGVRAEDGQDLAQSVNKLVEPSVVSIKLEKSLGSGFVVDPAGVIVTNYHVIEGAGEGDKGATVIFPDRSAYPVQGYLAIVPDKDLAVIKINPGEKKLPALRLTDKSPEKGSKAFALGSPLGLSGTISEGIVSGVRSGEEASEFMKALSRRDMYHDMGYDLDALWVQTTAPISHGNSGGPLVNSRGEVIGINTWCVPQEFGANLGFAQSSVIIKKVLDASGRIVHPLSELPPPRKKSEKTPGGNPDKSLAFWKSANRLRIELQKKTEAAEKQLLKIERRNPANPLQGLNGRLRKQAAVYGELLKLYTQYETDVKSLDNDGADPELVVMSLAESTFTKQILNLYRQLQSIASNQMVDDADLLDQHRQAKAQFESERTEIDTHLDVLRLKLSAKYQINFPTLEALQKEQTESLRTWSDRSGKYKLLAKYAGREKGKVRLKKEDGTELLIPLDKLSKTDQQYLKNRK